MRPAKMHPPACPCPCSFTKPDTDSGKEYYYALFKADVDKEVSCCSAAAWQLGERDCLPTGC